MAGAPTITPNRSVLIIGGSRGLGEAIVETYIDRGAHVVATVRGTATTPLHDFADTTNEAVEIERVDITETAELAALHDRLTGRTFDLLFIVAGVSLAAPDAIAADIPTEDFITMMVTNALSVMRTVETLADLVTPDGTIALMSSGQGSITNNTSGGFEVYRATKSALNQLMRSYAARHNTDNRTLLMMAPGWVKTDMGGPDAPLDISDSIPPLVTTVDAHRHTTGLHYLDRNGQIIPW